MKNGINKKEFPIQPEQLTYWRQLCNQGSGQCASCGIVEEESIIGSLIEVFLKNTDYPVALIEKITCEKMLREIPPDIIENAKEKARKSDNVEYTRWKRDESASASDFYLYYDKTGLTVYHSYVLSKFYSGWNSNKACYRCREKEDFYLECMASDIDAARKVFANKIVHKYTCDRSGCKLYEVAYPIMNDGKCIAVLIIGQIPQNEYDNVKDKLAENARRFEEQMTERIALKISNYLMALINELIPLSAPQDNTDENNDILPTGAVETDYRFYPLYERVSSVCDSFELYYNTPEDISDLCHIMTQKNGKASLTTKDIGPVESKKDIINRLGLQLSEYDTVQCKPSSPDSGKVYYILLVLRWGNDTSFISGKNKSSVKGFADTLYNILHDILMTQVSKAKQTMLSELMQNFSHDLNQKIEIVSNHASVMDNDIENGSIFIYDRAADFNKDIRNMLSQLRFFVDEARAKATSETVEYKMQYFQPYGTFLFNLNEYYYTVAQNQLCRLYAPSTLNVAMNPNRYPNMYADSVLIERCVNNLLTNAAKYSYEYTNFYLDCYYDPHDDPENYIIKVTNFCRQIPPEDGEKIFTRGYTSSPTGKGIGLAVVKEICERHGGSVKLTSNDVISEYNIPVLYRIMKEYGQNRQGFCERYSFGGTLFDELTAEYKRLRRTPADINNEVAYLKKTPAISLLNEVCAQGFSYDTTLTRRSIDATIYSPTARITFTVKIPFNPAQTGDIL